MRVNITQPTPFIQSTSPSSNSPTPRLRKTKGVPPSSASPYHRQQPLPSTTATTSSTRRREEKNKKQKQKAKLRRRAASYHHCCFLCNFSIMYCYHRFLLNSHFSLLPHRSCAALPACTSAASIAPSFLSFFLPVGQCAFLSPSSSFHLMEPLVGRAL